MKAHHAIHVKTQRFRTICLQGSIQNAIKITWTHILLIGACWYSFYNIYLCIYIYICYLKQMKQLKKANETTHTFHVNTLRPRHRGRWHFKGIYLVKMYHFFMIKISWKFVLKGSSNNIPALVQIMPWCRRGDKPLSKPMVVGLLTHICVSIN